MSEDNLIMNPFVDIHVQPMPKAIPFNPDEIEMITVQCPVRDRGLLIHDLTREKEAALFAFFETLVQQDGELEVPPDSPLMPALRRIGFAVRTEEIFPWPQYRISLRGDGRRLPRRFRSSPESAPAQGWRVAPTFVFQPDFALHPKVTWPAEYSKQEGLLRCFAGGEAFWVGEPATEAVLPFWVEPEDAALVAQLVPGQAPPPLPKALERDLAAAGALVSATATPCPPSVAWEGRRPEFERERYLVARDLLHPFELTALREYYRCLLEAGLIRLGDRQVNRRYSLYNETISRFLHVRMRHAMSAVVGQPVVPSFSYFLSYADDAELEVHSDRPQAEFSISLQVDYLPEPEAETGWPLCFRRADGEVRAADLRIGDAAFYRGAELPHFRARLPREHQSTHLILEYVPEGFGGLLL